MYRRLPDLTSASRKRKAKVKAVKAEAVVMFASIKTALEAGGSKL